VNTDFPSEGRTRRSPYNFSEARAWDMATLAPRFERPLALPEGVIRSWLSPDGGLLLTAGSALHAWDVGSGTLVACAEAIGPSYRTGIPGWDFDPSGIIVIPETVGQSGRMETGSTRFRLRLREGNEQLWELKHEQGGGAWIASDRLMSMTFSPDGRSLL